MTKQTEALKLALEWDEMRKYIMPYMVRDVIREALAERCVCGEPDTPGTHRTDGPCLAEQSAQDDPDLQDKDPELVEQPAQQQEPVAWYDEEYDCAYTAAELDGGNVDGLLPLYTSPPSLSLAQRTWVELTDEDIQEVRENCGITHHAIKTIEAKLREKNT